MPQAPGRSSNCSSNKKKKKKGRTPAHQNTFAFRHNPKSKKTERILSSPNRHVCRRCYEKIEWRKRYRKYKPRTQPRRCNLCHNKTVMAAYHTICTKCTTSDQALCAMKRQQQQLQEQRLQETSNAPKERVCMNDTAPADDDDDDDNDGVENNTNCASPAPVVDESLEAALSQLAIDSKESLSSSKSDARTVGGGSSSSNYSDCHRVCAMCTKEPALPDEDDDEGNESIDALLRGGKRFKLRERRALERKLLRKQEAANEAARSNENQDEEERDGDELHCNHKMRDDGMSDSCGEGNGIFDDESDSVEDPFVQAVGGEERLLTGEAYQNMLLAREREQIR